MSKHPVFCSILTQINDDPLADFKIILERQRTVRELLRKTPGSLGAKLFDRLDRITSIQKQTPWHTHAML